jgi:hypothetical protein
MDHSEIREPENSQSAANADAGEAQKQTDDEMARRESGPPIDYDAREANKSTTRKPMGPPLKDSEETSDNVRMELRDEEPVDPA